MNKSDEVVDILEDFSNRIDNFKYKESILDCVNYILNKNSKILDLLKDIAKKQDEGELLVQTSINILFRKHFSKELREWVDYNKIKKRMLEK